MRTLITFATVAVLACSTLRQPSPYTGFLPDAGTVGEAVPTVMAEVEALGYRIESVERDAGLVVGVRENELTSTRVTVTLREAPDHEGLRVRVVGQSRAGPSFAEDAARQVRDRLHVAFGVD